MNFGYHKGICTAFNPGALSSVFQRNTKFKKNFEKVFFANVASSGRDESIIFKNKKNLDMQDDDGDGLSLILDLKSR